MHARVRARRTTIAIATTATFGLVLAACSGDASTGDEASGEGDSLVIATASQPASFSYETSATGYAAAEFFANTQATLIRNPYVEGSDGQDPMQDYYSFEPVLAESYDVSEDGLTYTFTLDPDAVSTAGNSLTADDVIFSLERKFETASSIVSFVSAPVITDPSTQVEKIDDMTVSFTIADRGYGFTLLSLLANTPFNIYDSTVLSENATDDDPYAVEWSGSNPNSGFGAYEVVDFSPGEEIVYEANEGFVLGEPPIERIVQRVVADAGQRANLVRAGDVQIATQLRPADQVELAREGVFVPEVDTNAITFMPLTTTLEPFDDVEVRRALAYAIPYDAIMEDVYRGRAAPLAGILPSSAPGYDGSGLEPFTYDPETAESILSDAGYDEPVSFTLTVNNGYPDLQETAVQIQSAAQAAGFDITIEPVNNATFQEGLAAKSFQASMGRDYAIVQSPPYVLSLFYTAGSPLNWPDWEDSAFYEAIDEGNAVGDPLTDEAGAYWNVAEQRIQSEVPTLWMAWVQPLNAFVEGIDGYAFRSDNVIDYSELSFE